MKPTVLSDGLISAQPIAQKPYPIPYAYLDAARDELQKLLPRDFSQRAGFSTRLVNQPFVGDLESLYARAAKVYPHYEARVRALAQQTGSAALFGGMKKAKRARSKAQFKYTDPGQ